MFIPGTLTLTITLITMEKRKKRMAGFFVHEALNKGRQDNVCAIVIWLES